MKVTLENVYGKPPYFIDILYDLLKERDDSINISHSKLPSLEAHTKFVLSFPYKEWFIIKHDGEVVGQIYLTRNNEVGIFIFKEFQRYGHGKKALKLLLARHKGERLLANISPKNDISKAFFEWFGFKHIQNTYELNT